MPAASRRERVPGLRLRLNQQTFINRHYVGGMHTLMSELEEWRRRIDGIDQQLVKLLNERSRCAVEIGQVKCRLKLPTWQPEREAEILRNVVKSNHGPLDDAAIRRLFERIIDEARALERRAMESRSTAPGE